MKNGQWVDVECATPSEYSRLRAMCRHYPRVAGATVSSDRPEFKILNSVVFARNLCAYRGVVLPEFATKEESDLHREE